MDHTALDKSFEIVNLCAKNNIATFTFARQHNLHCHFVVIGEKAECTDAQKVTRRPFVKYSLFNCISMCCLHQCCLDVLE